MEKYDKIWDKFSNSVKKGFDSEPVYNEKYLKTKIISYEGKINVNFHDDGILKKSSQCICKLVILIDSVFKKSQNNHSQVLLEEYKHNVKDKKMNKHIEDGLEIPSNDSDEEISSGKG